MRRPLWFRLLSVAWALWFGIALSEPAALHSCPMHGSHAAQPTAASDHAGHHDAPAPAERHDCTCIGAGCCAPTVSGPTEIVAAVSAADAIITVAILAPRHDAVHFADAPYSHPFATAPPVASSL